VSEADERTPPPVPADPVPSDAAARRVPALYRAGVFVLATVAGVLGFRAAWWLIGQQLRAPLTSPVPAFFLIMSGGLLVGHWWTFRSVESRGWASIAFSRRQLTWRGAAAGAALGSVAVGLPSAVLLTLGWLRIEPAGPGDWWWAALASLALLIPAALWEELLTRGYLFTLISERVGARRAILLTSVLFGLLHVENAGATGQSVALVTLAGIFLGSIRVAFNSLWTAWSAHVAWNFVMAALLHTAVSGVGMGTPNYRTVDAGPDWATGGSWGPEAGFITAVGLMLGIYLMLRRSRRGA
jgi:membrane protease YdiL (CAAX protease family)